MEVFTNVGGSPHVPPLFVVVLLRDTTIKHLPPPLVHQVAEGQESNLIQGYAHQVVDGALYG